VCVLRSYPYAMAPAKHMPRAADLPLPLAAVNATVDRSFFSLTASKKVNTARACREEGSCGSVYKERQRQTEKKKQKHMERV
jgi:hypothetical protein